MAHTKTDYTIPGGFTGADVLAKWGEVLAGIGLMANATAWHDSFTDVSGSEVRILAMTYTGVTGTYNTVYHSFMIKSSYDGLWYTTYYNWDTAAHRSQGSPYYDHVYLYENPDNASTASWSNYYVKLFNPSNASDYTITTLEGAAGEAPLIWCHNITETGLFYFVPTDSAVVVVDDFNTYGPPPFMSMNISGTRFYTTPLMFLDRSSTGYGDTGIGTNDWMSTPGIGSHVSGGNVGSEGSTDAYELHTRVGKPAMSLRVPRSPYFYIAKNHRAAGMAYNAVFGDNFALISGETGGSYTPAAGDVLVVSAGVEEYLVLKTVSETYGYADWNAILSRSV